MPDIRKIERVTAIHEAAHAVAAIRSGLMFDRVEAVPDEPGEVDGALYWTDLHDELGLEMAPEALAVVLLAGPCAEARVRGLRFDRVLSGEAAMDDRASLSALGLTDEQFIAASREVLSLIEDEWPSIERVAAALVNGKPLHYDEVRALLDTGG
jgi:hypothetical protein